MSTTREDLIAEVIRTMLGRYEIEDWWTGRAPLELLIGAILSQRTNWKNARKALESLKKKFPSLTAVADASLRDIEEAIRPAGLHEVKAYAIREVARLAKIGELDRILALPYKEARARLMSIKGIGPKTADVFLLFARREPVLPVDTHIFRIMRRLGVAEENEDYESLRSKLERAVPPSERLYAHIALIRFGREVCRPLRPLCETCPLTSLCRYYASRSRKRYPRTESCAS